jgi:hypothetical protein
MGVQVGRRTVVSHGFQNRQNHLMNLVRAERSVPNLAIQVKRDGFGHLLGGIKTFAVAGQGMIERTEHLGMQVRLAMAVRFKDPNLHGRYPFLFKPVFTSHSVNNFG